MAISDEPISRISGGLEFVPDANSKSNGLYMPKLTPQERDAIDKTEENIGCVIYNLQTQELEYLAPTFNWIMIATEGGEFTFEELTVTGTTTLNILNASGLATFSNNLSVAHNAFISGTMVGKRCGGGLYSTSTPEFAVTANTPIKIPGTTTASFQNFFLAANNRLTYAAPTSPSVPAITCAVTGEFSFQFSTNAIITLAVAINGTALNPVSRQTINDPNDGHISVSPILGIGDTEYVELWVTSNQNGTFTAGGTMNLHITQV